MSTLQNKHLQIPSSYRAVALSQGELRLATFPMPDISGLDGLVVKLRLAGICRSDLKEIVGSRSIRSDFGHEIAGTVEWSSEAVSLTPGDSVCLDPHVAISRAPGLGEFVIANGDPGHVRQAFPRVPASLQPEKVVFCEPMACTYHCIVNLQKYLQRARLDGLQVGILGAGNAGTLLGLLVKHLGATVTLFNRRTPRLEFLAQKGIFDQNIMLTFDQKVDDMFEVVVTSTAFLDSHILQL